MTLLTPDFLDTKTYPWAPSSGKAGVRQVFADLLQQEGVFGAGDYKVSAGAGMTVAVAAGAAWVLGDDTARQGLYHEFNDASVSGVAVPAANGTNPRIDQVVLRIYDSTVIGGAQDQATIEVIQGTATSGATLDNRSGAAALPNSALRLADVLVPAGSSSVSAGNIRDRRPWARGAYRRIAITAGDYTRPASSGMALIDSTNLQPRIECSGVPLRVRLYARPSFGAGSAQGMDFELWVDGARSAASPTRRHVMSITGEASPDLSWDIVPAAGSHLIGVAAASPQAQALTIAANATNPLVLEIEEIVRQNADNT